MFQQEALSSAHIAVAKENQASTTKIATLGIAVTTDDSPSMTDKQAEAEQETQDLQQAVQTLEHLFVDKKRKTGQLE